MKEYFSVYENGEGITFSFKDNIVVKEMESTASSKILKGYKPLFDATVVKKVKDAGYHISGKTVQDEFGFGSFCTNTEKIPKNPLFPDRVTGGSSGGAAGAAKTIKNHIAIAESTGGSIANPAAFCNVIGLTPTYGLVSRYGLIDYANSLDKIGVISSNLDLVRLGLKIIAGYDDKDSTSVKTDIPDYTKKEKLKPVLGIPKSYVETASPEIKKDFENLINSLKDKAVIKEIDLHLNKKYSISTYYIIAMAEASTNLAKYTGLRYGLTKDLEGDFESFASSIRGSSFGEETKRRIMLGTFTRMAGYRDQYYDKALRVRQLLIDEYKEILKDVDAIIHPTMPIPPPKFDEVKDLSPLDVYNMDLLTVGANLAGLPHLSMPLKSKLPSGFMLTTDHFEEKKLLDIGDLFE